MLNQPIVHSSPVNCNIPVSGCASPTSDESQHSSTSSLETQSNEPRQSISSQLQKKKEDGLANLSSRKKRNTPVFWTNEECDRLREAIKLYGPNRQWKKITEYVGTRSENQCINKWKNDLSKEGKRQRWDAKASAQLNYYLREGLSVKAIQEKMPSYTYIQIYQQINKRMKRCAKWEEWEIEKLKELKKSGVSSYTVIGNLLNNRHCDDVKNMWKKLIRKSLVSSRHNRNQTPKNQTVLRTVFRLAIVDHFHREALHSLRLQYRVHARLDEPTTTIVDDSLAHPSQLRIHRQELDLHGIQCQRVLVHHLHLLRTLRRLLLRRMLLALHRIPSPLLPYSSPSSSVVASSPTRPRRTPGWHFSPSPTSSSNTSRPTKLCHWQRWWQQVAIHTPSTSRPGAGPSFIAFSTHRIV